MMLLNPFYIVMFSNGHSQVTVYVMLYSFVDTCTVRFNKARSCKTNNHLLKLPARDNMLQKIKIMVKLMI